MLRAAGPIVGRIYRYYIMYETTIKFQFSFLIQKRVLFYSLTQRSLPTSWGTWTSPERIGKRAKIFILKGLELFTLLLLSLCQLVGYPSCTLPTLPVTTSENILGLLGLNSSSYDLHNIIVIPCCFCPSVSWWDIHLAHFLNLPAF